MKIMTFLTDFGIKNSYVSQMKGTALSITDAKIIDLAHEITPHNIREGAFVLRTAVPHFPIGTVHVAVVDPGVGTSRRGIVITTKSQVLVGPDNGLLLPAAHLLGDFIVYEIKNLKYMSKQFSNTFHGRDIFTPVAAHILNGILFEDVGPVIKDYVTLDFGKPEITDKTASGKIIYIDSFGNLITNIEENELIKHFIYGNNIMAFIGKKRQKLIFEKSYGFVKKGEAIATIGGSNYLEISLNQGNAQEKFKVKPDDEVKIFF